MSYTIHHILSYPLMKNAKILSGQTSIHSKPVESISVMEVPVEQFVRKNEFVLTTAMGCQEDEELFLSFIKEIFESEASALAIAVGRHVHAVPDQVLNFARSHHFPLIELPWELRFSDIIELVMKGIHDWEQDVRQKYELLHMEILQLYIRGQWISDALRLMETTFNTRVYLLQQGGVYTSQEIEEKKDLSLRFQDINWREPSVSHTSYGTILQIYPFGIFNQPIAVLILETSDGSWVPVPHSILEQTVLVLNLWFKKDPVYLEKEEIKKTSFLRMLIKGQWEDFEMIHVQASQYGIRKSEQYVCLTAFPEADGREGKWLQNNHFIEAKVAECAIQLNIKHLCVIDDECLIIFLKIADGNYSEIHSFIDKVEKELNTEDFPILSWGVNDSLIDIQSFPAGYEFAKAALKIGRKQNGPGHRSLYSHTVIYRVISQMSNDESMNELVQKTLGPLISYNQKHSLDLIHTLTCFINCNRNVSQTARALSLQRQSLLYRIQKIETLTKRSLSNPDDLFVLQLCLKVFTTVRD